MNASCRGILTTEKHKYGLCVALSSKTEEGPQQIPGVSAAITPVPASVADVANHSWHFPAEPTCRRTPLDSHHQLVQIGAKDGIYLPSSVHNAVSVWWILVECTREWKHASRDQGFTATLLSCIFCCCCSSDASKKSYPFLFFNLGSWYHPPILSKTGIKICCPQAMFVLVFRRVWVC